jgi:predicted N-acyltransferase
LTPGYRDFDDFLMSLSQEKRKKIRQERRKVAEAGIVFRWSLGTDISDADWDFFYQCYERTYYEHGNAPYLSRDFFRRMQRTMPENWLLFVGEHVGQDGVRQNIATSLIAVSANNGAPRLATSRASLPPEASEPAQGCPSLRSLPLVDSAASDRVAYGRYWGAVARVDCLHFEACYYQPLQWCIEHGYQRFEGGAQGEHKMARALLPVKTTSAHWLAHPSFADAVERFLEREGQGVERYMDELEKRSPLKQASPEKTADSLSNK